MRFETFDAFGFENGEPTVYGIWVTWAHQAVFGNPVRRPSIGHFQDGGSAFLNVGTPIVIAMPDQAFADFIVLVNGVLHSVREGSSSAMLGATGKTSVLLPYLCPKRCATSG